MGRELPGSLRRLLQRDPRATFRFDERWGVIAHLRGDLAKITAKGEKARDEIVRYLRANEELFGKAIMALDKARLSGPVADPGGGFSLVFHQRHGRVAVHGGSLRVHVSAEGVLDTVVNRFVPGLEAVPGQFALGAVEAARLASEKLKATVPPLAEPELLVYPHRDKPYLAWKLRLQGMTRGQHGCYSQWVVYVDALNGDLIFYYDDIQTGWGIGRYSGPGPLNTIPAGPTCLLLDRTRVPAGGPEIQTDDADGTSPSSDPDDNWEDPSQGAEVDAHRYTALAMDYYGSLGHNSFDGTGSKAQTVVHFKTNWNNAMWFPAMQRVYLGDGDGVNYAPLCCDDIVAHEWTHGVTEHTCALQYQGESGALNEAFSDVMAAFITGDWLVGEDCWLRDDAGLTTAPATRNMVDPTNGGQWDNSSDSTAMDTTRNGHGPSHYDDRYTGSADNGGVHINSGIINHLFYLLTVGGNHAISGITVAGIGQPAAGRLLWQCMAVNLVGNPTADFLQFREAMLDACLDLYPGDLNKLTQVKNAFNAVGIGPDIYVRDSLADTGAEPYPGGYLWASPDIINRQALSADPIADFSNMANGSLWQNVEYGQDNYIYLRLQNRGSHGGDCTAAVYFSAATTFGTPSSWTFIGSLAETGITPGSVRIAGPLTFPAGLIPGPGHYCMIAVVTSPADPAPDHTLISSVSSYLEYVRNTNNIAYRNMDVVDLVANSAMPLSVSVQGLGDRLEPFDLRLDLSAVPPGLKVRICGPARTLDAAFSRGLKLVGREKDQSIYEPLLGKALRRNKLFIRRPPEAPPGDHGFDGILAAGRFSVVVECLWPDAPAVRLSKPREEGHLLAIKQYWRGQAVGAMGFRVRLKGA
ncbi:MAG: M4 family metallopeptidase [bacterium]|nr:M4 family metallopeptidase [bacterium]